MKYEGFIIYDKHHGGYWSDEEGGRFSEGALYEKKFETEEDAEVYLKKHNIESGKIGSYDDYCHSRLPVSDEMN